jgi:serine/threonine protein kinase
VLDECVNQDGLYHMTGMTGAIRYMAPEVGLNKPYNLKADVYSWSMVFWYIMALEPPMGMYTHRMFMDRVFVRNCRPAIYKEWTSSIGDVMKRCWSEHIDDRPSFNEISIMLREEIKRVDPTISQIMVNDDSPYDSQTEETNGSSRS